MKALTSTDFHFEGQKSVYHGKVRDVYNINDDIMVMVATDRISAFDVILPKGIPFKGQVLNQIAAKYGVGGSSIDEVIAKVVEKGYKSEFEKVKEGINIAPKKDLMEEHSNIGDLKKYNLSLQNIHLSAQVTSYLTGRKIENVNKDDQK